jgi:hypothetical protein
MSPEMLDATVEGIGEYVAFGFILFGICAALGVAWIVGTFFFRWMVLKSIGVIRRRAFYRRDYASNAQGGATTWKL